MVIHIFAKVRLRANGCGTVVYSQLQMRAFALKVQSPRSWPHPEPTPPVPEDLFGCGRVDMYRLVRLAVVAESSDCVVLAAVVLCAMVAGTFHDSVSGRAPMRRGTHRRTQVKSTLRSKMAYRMQRRAWDLSTIVLRILLYTSMKTRTVVSLDDA